MRTMADVILEEISNDDSYDEGKDCDRIVTTYKLADDATKDKIDNIFIALCGWSMNHLIDIHEGQA